MRKLLVGSAALLLTGAVALAANVPFVVGPGSNEPSQTNATINALIQSLYSGMNGLIASQPGPVATTATTIAQTFATTAIPTGTLSLPGQMLHAKCWGIGSSSTNAKSVALSFGTVVTPASVIVTSGNISAANAQWGIDLYIQAVTATANYVALGTGQFTSTVVPTVAKQVTSDNLQSALIVSCSGQTPTAVETGGLTMEGFSVEQVK
jgi:hypothetical protein